MEGSPASIVQQQNSNDTIVAYSQHSCTVLSAGYDGSRPIKTVNFPYQMPETYSKNILAQHYQQRITEKMHPT